MGTLAKRKHIKTHLSLGEVNAFGFHFFVFLNCQTTHSLTHLVHIEKIQKALHFQTATSVYFIVRPNMCGSESYRNCCTQCHVCASHRISHSCISLTIQFALERLFWKICGESVCACVAIGSDSSLLVPFKMRRLIKINLFWRQRKYPVICFHLFIAKPSERAH